MLDINDADFITRQVIDKSTDDIMEIINKKHTTYIEAVLIYAQENNMDLEVLKDNLSDGIKSKLESEAIDLRLLKKPTTFRFDV